MQGVLPIIFTKDDSFSLAFNNFYLIDNVFIPRNSCLINKYGGCSLVVKRTVVVRVTGVRFSPSAFPTLKKMVMKILFVCKNNRFRSRIATEYFNKINKNKKVKGGGAGVVVGAPLTNFQLRIAKNAGINIKGKPRGLSSKLLIEQDIIVIVADNVPSLIFKDREYKAKVVRWNIKDVYDNDEKKILKTIGKIKKKVERLVKKLENIK